MKVLTLLLAAAFLAPEAIAAPASMSTARSATTLTVGEANGHIFGSSAAKRRKRKKSRPAYRRLGVLPTPPAAVA